MGLVKEALSWTTSREPLAALVVRASRVPRKPCISATRNTERERKDRVSKVRNRWRKSERRMRLRNFTGFKA